MRKYVLGYDYSATAVTETNFANSDFEAAPLGTGWTLSRSNLYHSYSVGSGGHTGNGLYVNIGSSTGNVEAKQSSLVVPRSASFLRYWVKSKWGGYLFDGVRVNLYDWTTQTTFLLDQVNDNDDAWTQRWIDLSPWAGRQVNIYFKTENVQGNVTGTGEIWLDEVYLGGPAPARRR